MNIILSNEMSSNCVVSENFCGILEARLMHVWIGSYAAYIAFMKRTNVLLQDLDDSELNTSVCNIMHIAVYRGHYARICGEAKPRSKARFS